MSKALAFAKRYFAALGGSLHLFTVGLASPRHRQLLRAICRHYGWEFRSVEPRIPRVSVRDVVRGEQPVRLREVIGVDGNTTLEEMTILVDHVRHAGVRTVFEVGTFNGRTALNLASNLPPDGRVYTLDLPRVMIDATDLRIEAADRVHIDKASPGALFRGADVESRITQLLGDSARFDSAPFEGQMDMVFVDGSHSREYVLSDSRLALRLLRPGAGAIFWHDYDVWDGVTKGLNELHAAGGEFAGLRHIAGTSLAFLVRA